MHEPSNQPVNHSPAPHARPAAPTPKRPPFHPLSRALRGALLPVTALALAPLLLISAGCEERSASSRLLEMPPSATDIDPQTATADYWWNKPAPVKFTARDYDKILAATQDAFRRRFFAVDSVDVRAGVVMSEPLTAAQFFEPWRQDNSTADDVARSSLGTYRRTVRVDIVKQPDGRYQVSPRVLVERQAILGRRVTGVLGFQTFTELDQASITRKYQGEDIPGNYWYATARDYNLEATLGEDIAERLQ